MEVERLDILRRCSSTTVFQNNKLRALLAVTFPPVTVGPLTGRSVPITFEGDTFPQFSQNKKSRFHCEVCIPFQKWAMENGKSHAHLKWYYDENRIFPIDTVGTRALKRCSGLRRKKMASILFSRGGPHEGHFWFLISC